MLAASDHSQMSVFSFCVSAEVQTLGLEDPFIENQVAGRWPEWETGSKLRIWKISPSFILLIYFSHCLSCLLFVPIFWYHFCSLYYMYVALKLYLFPAAGCLTWKNYKSFENKAGGNATEKGIQPELWWCFGWIASYFSDKKICATILLEIRGPAQKGSGVALARAI